MNILVLNWGSSSVKFQLNTVRRVIAAPQRF